jgi:class 3 adenylate cyclase/tetratricopeptide (TPR) repeat protein
VRVCQTCGQDNPDGFRVCGYCGTPFEVAEPPPEVRKTVTVVFSDLVGSTSLGESLDSETLREVLARYFAAMQAALEGHGGVVEKFIGDAIVAVFGLPKLREDDAERAVRAALAMRSALGEVNQELESGWGVTLAVRTGINTGEVVAGDITAGQRLVTGDTVNVAARLEQAAGAGEILLGDLTYRLVRKVVEAETVQPLELKGKAENVAAWKLLALQEEVAPKRRETPLVGRERELATLMESFEAAREASRCRLATILGAPGMGKSRLVDEFVHTLGDQVSVARGRCLSHGRGVTFWPIVEIARQTAGILDDDAPELARAKIAELVGDQEVTERLASVIGLSTAQFPVEEGFWGVRKFLESLCEPCPLVVLIEDVHWAETTMLDLLEHVLSAAEAPLLMICTARPEFFEIRPEWQGLSDSVSLLLKPLTEDEAARVAANALGSTGLYEAVQERIIVAAEGNPLFVEQMLSMMIEDGVLVREDGQWASSSDLGEITVPPSIQALLAARLDLLGPGERALIEAASVAGFVFPEDALRELLSQDLAQHLADLLGSLSRKHLIHSEPRVAGSDVRYRFDHVLIRDAAYQGMLKRARATLHERFVGWADRVNEDRDRATEFEEILGYHLEQAYTNLKELGSLDEHGREVGRRAAERLSSAGGRAFARGDMPAAANLLRRAVMLLPQGDASRLELLPNLGEALIDIGEFPWAELFLEEASTTHEDGLVPGLAQLLLFRLKAQAGSSERWSERLVDEASRTIAEADPERDAAMLATIWRLLALAHGSTGHYGRATDAAERAMEQARRVHDGRQIRLAAAHYAVAALHGPTPVPDAIRRCEEIASEVQGDRRTQGVVTSTLAALLAMRGEFDRARLLYREAQSLLADLGPTVVGATTSLETVWVERLAGDLAAAEQELRRDYESLTELGERYFLSTVTGELARVLYAQGRHDEAEQMSQHAQELADADDIESQIRWRTVQAKLLARKGNCDVALILIGEAVDLVARTDAVIAQAETLVDLAEVLRHAGRGKDAEEALDDAIALFETKGNLVAAEGASRVRAVGLFHEAVVTVEEGGDPVAVRQLGNSPEARKLARRRSGG